ncbi:MAG: hypothetical protein HZB92_05210 [Euryarchaeota archaeon]|nr:hypothetical protein [Euryarchaeota archaeon]
MIEEEFHVRKEIRFKRILCIILGIMILILPLSIYTLKKNSLESSGTGVVVFEPVIYWIILTNGIGAIVSGIIFSFFMGKNKYLDYVLICALGIYLVMASNFGLNQTYLGT